MSSQLTSGVEAWRASGQIDSFRGRAIFTRTVDGGGSGPVLVFLHGYPSSSYDFRELLSELPGRDMLLFDFLGFGLSDKPRDHTYSLFWQADLAEDLIRRMSLEIVLDRVESLIVEQGLLGRLFDFGSVSIVGTGGTKDPFHLIADPLGFRRAVQEQLARPPRG